MAKRTRQQPSVKKRREEAQRRQAEQNKMIKAAAAVLAVLVLAFMVWQLWPEPEPEPVVQGEALTGERPLARLDPALRNGYYDAPPEMMLESGVDYQALIETEQGDMLFDLFEAEAPLTVNNFVFLATQGYYDNTTFHRVLPDFMAQGGDPTGTGTGGPGYEFADEFDTGYDFSERGMLAMANANQPELDVLGTNGSQFFITFVDTSYLNGRHTIFGRLLEGDDVLSAISLRDPSTATAPGDTILRIDILEN